jgi:hypothetical protein
MDLPKCKICGERHRLGACSPTSSDGGVKARARVAAPEVANTEPSRVQLAEVASGPSEAKFDRLAYYRNYMREYMREYRKRKK